jgi:DHA3 family macrolide efflux protein-like MFS transporter
MFADRIQLFKNSNFSFLAFSNLITVTGGGLCYIALTWYVLTLNNHISSVIINSLCFWLPSTLLGPFVGNWIDRLPRKKIYSFANLMRAFTFIIFGTVLHYSPHVFWCYAINGLNGVLFTVLSPAGFALVSEVVKKEELTQANATMDMIFEIGNIGGMALAGLFMQYFGMVTVFYIVGFLVLIGSVMIARMDIKKENQLHEAKPVRIFQDSREAFYYLKKHPLIALLYLVNLCVFLQIMTSPIVLAPYVRFTLNQGAHIFSLTEICLGIGIIFGSLFIPFLKDKLGWYQTNAISVIISGLGLFSLYVVHHTIFTLCVYGINGFFFTYWVLILSRIQALTTAHFQGRLQSFFMSFSATCVIIFYLALAKGSRYISVNDCYLILSSFSVIALIALIFLKIKKLPLDDDKRK